MSAFGSRRLQRRSFTVAGSPADPGAFEPNVLSSPTLVVLPVFDLHLRLRRPSGWWLLLTKVSMNDTVHT